MYNGVIRWSRRRQRWCRPRRWVPKAEAHYLLVGLELSILVLYLPWRGLYPLSSWKGSDTLSGRTPHVTWEEIEMRKKKIQAVGSADGPSRLASSETKILTALPNVVDHCCVTRYDDGSARATGWITIKTVGPMWVVAVKDPDGCCQMMCSATALDDALALADVMLGADDAPWQPDPFLLNTGSKKRKN